MALTDYKITSSDVNPVKIVGRDAVLSGTVAQNQQVFDDYSDMIVTKFNALVDYLALNMETAIDNDTLALYLSMGWIPPD